MRILPSDISRCTRIAFGHAIGDTSFDRCAVTPLDEALLSIFLRVALFHHVVVSVCLARVAHAPFRVWLFCVHLRLYQHTAGYLILGYQQYLRANPHDPTTGGWRHDPKVLYGWLPQNSTPKGCPHNITESYGNN